MGKKTTSLGPLGSKFFSLAQHRQQTLVRQGELQESLGLTKSQEHTLLKRLTNKGYILRLHRGIYLVPAKLPAGGYWRPNDFYVIEQYMKILDANYYIGGLYAAYYHGLIQQIPSQFLVYNDKYSGNKHFGTLYVSFIKTKSKNIVGFNIEKVPNYGDVHIATKAKSILDIIQDWGRYKLLEDAYQWLGQCCQDEKFLMEFIKLARDHSNKNTIRRIGYYLEKLGVSEQKLIALKQKLSPLKSYVSVYPNRDKQGKKNKKWQIIDNA